MIIMELNLKAKKPMIICGCTKYHGSLIKQTLISNLSSKNTELIKAISSHPYLNDAFRDWSGEYLGRW